MNRFVRDLLASSACLFVVAGGVVYTSPMGSQAAVEAALPADIFNALAAAAAEGDQALLDAVAKAVEESPALADLIVAQAAELSTCGST